MSWKTFFSRRLSFGLRLTRLHHANAFLFLLLSVTGLLLFSTFYRSQFPSSRVWIKDIHIWIGIISILPLMFYAPKMSKHFLTLRKKPNHRINLFFIMVLLITLILSGLVLTFHRYFPSFFNTTALFIHGVTTWIGVPYAIYHSLTRSQWFNRLSKSKHQQQDPKFFTEDLPIYRRRSFLKMATGSVLAVVFAPTIWKWLRPYLPESLRTTAPEENNMVPLPKPAHAEPIGGGREGEFRYYTVTEMPTFTNENWSFTIDGLVDTAKTYHWEEFVKLKRTVQVHDFHCVTGWSVYNITWEGIPLKEMLERAGIQKKANYVKFYSGDGIYTDSLTIRQALNYDMMVAVLMDGELIPQKSGGPVRLITPEMYAYKSVKWLNRIELIEEEHIGYWEQRGYAQDAWVGRPMNK
ncbi:molybdopterin-dependent oxidoreductase [Radiobacillus kanasensis]|uniref:molybdopterin-dependent oxidoreductase n=1 Tax=Radiobacillus kanasensis TaxID=2844358 RepID=UPI001E564234|nr:molybdopterin-dependent oxidoreductase [Radiobacillus kanasensis]UFT98191.1 molybdopterin-dependent oxidoreductase [Radiobacillus kanasensis]